MNLHDPHARALAATALFILAGVLGLLTAKPSYFIAPEVLFYATLLVNTFFSIRFFSAITPPSSAQSYIDALLVVCYIALALSIGSVWGFLVAALFVFIAAPAKYALMLGVVPRDKLLEKKLLIDLAGTAMCATAFWGALVLFYPLTTLWLMALVFLFANIYFLAIRPMYRL